MRFWWVPTHPLFCCEALTIIFIFQHLFSAAARRSPWHFPVSVGCLFPWHRANSPGHSQGPWLSFCLPGLAVCLKGWYWALLQFFLMRDPQKEVLTPQQSSPGAPAVRKENVFQEGHLVWRYHSASTSPITRTFHFKFCFCLNFCASSGGIN